MNQYELNLKLNLNEAIKFFMFFFVVVKICPWFRGPCFIDYVDSLPQMNRSINGPVRMPIVDKYKDMGTVVMGKIESGMIKLNDKLAVMPNKVKVEVVNIYCEEDETDSAICGENVKLKLKGIEEEEITGGFVLCDLKDTCQFAKVFDAQVMKKKINIK